MRIKFRTLFVSVIALITLVLFNKDYIFERMIQNENSDQISIVQVSFLENTDTRILESREEISKIFEYIKHLNYQSKSRTFYTPIINMKFFDSTDEIKYDFNLERSTNNKYFIRNKSQFFHIEAELDNSKYEEFKSLLNL